MSNEEYFDVFVAEDDDQISALLDFLLKREGYKVKVVKNGREAIESIDAIALPKLILLDVMMPYYDGFQVIKHIREKEDWKDVPIMMLTAKSQEADIVKALEAGANDYIVKPFQPVELVARLKSKLR